MRPLVLTLLAALGSAPAILRAGPEAELARVALLLRRLGHDEFDAREAASAQLKAAGPAAMSLLRKASSDPDPEVARRAEAALRDVAGRAGKRELLRWQGAWRSGESVLHFKGDRWAWTSGDGVPSFDREVRVVDFGGGLVAADLMDGDRGRPCLALFRLEGDNLHYCGTYDRPRATEIVTHNHDPYYFKWQRVKD